jgi:hypothetical protein
MDPNAPPVPGDVSRLLIALLEGKTDAPGELFALVYDRLPYPARSVSALTVKRGWQQARALLHHEPTSAGAQEGTP